MDIELFERRFVLWREATNWVLHRTLENCQIGPTLAIALNEHRIALRTMILLGRRAAAADSLIQKGYQGKICLRAWHGDADFRCSPLRDPIKIPPDFLADCRVCWGIQTEPGHLGIPPSLTGKGGTLHNPIVLFEDLIQEYPISERLELLTRFREGHPSAEDLIYTTSPALPWERRRGPRGRYAWRAFAAEMVRVAATDGLPRKQAEFERYMADWCVENWGEEPPPSSIREWIAPVYAHRLVGQTA
jgi:hypothetical protein